MGNAGWARRSLLLCLKCAISLVSPVAVASNHKAFLSTESGASALDACRNPMILGSQPATADFAEEGYLLLAHASRVHLLTGSGAKVGCCLPKYGATSVESGLSGGHQRPSMSACRPAVRRPSVESVESMAMVHVLYQYTQNKRVEAWGWAWGGVVSVGATSAKIMVAPRTAEGLRC